MDKCNAQILHAHVSIQPILPLSHGTGIAAAHTRALLTRILT